LNTDAVSLTHFDRCIEVAADEIHAQADSVFWTRQDIVQRLLNICWSDGLLAVQSHSVRPDLKIPLVHADVSGVDLGLLSAGAADAYLGDRSPEFLRSVPLLAGLRVIYLRTMDNWWHTYDPAIKDLKNNPRIGYARLLIVALTHGGEDKSSWFSEQVDMLKEKWTGSWGGKEVLKVYCVPAGSNGADPICLEFC
jgi:hypothetical protein